MKTVLLAGGFGQRFSEETSICPKPMIDIAGRPILFHIIDIYRRQGFNDFIIAGGYKYKMIESACAAEVGLVADVVDTGLGTLTGGRLARLRHLLGSRFMLAYGDGLADIDLSALMAFHVAHGRLATVTAVRPPARFGHLEIGEAGRVIAFEEKGALSEPLINGGFFVFEPGVLDYLGGDECILEGEPLARLAAAGELFAYGHPGFWKPMDTLRDKIELETLAATGTPPWHRR
jgi:glucose-1-phosphate cytidylyltransferase